MRDVAQEHWLLAAISSPRHGETARDRTQREWAVRLAPILVEMVRKHTGSRDEIDAQIARELYCSIAVMRGSI